MELFEQIRRDHEREGLGTRALARRHGVHRRTVRQALESAVPPARKRPEGRPAPALGPYREVIEQWLDEDKTAPAKQRHTAKRIWQRLVDEFGAEVAETTVREYVRNRRRERGEKVQAMIPQAHTAGRMGEVDWGEAKVVLAGELTTVHLFLMRACFSGAAFVEASPVETQQAFLELHAQAFAWFGGSFIGLRYDNLGSAVKQVLKGRRRVETDRFVAMRSHYLFDSHFTLVGLEGAHEKGGVEGEVGRLRRNHLVPVPIVADWHDLRALMAEARERDLDRTITGREHTVGEALEVERPRLRVLPDEPFDAAETTSPRVNAKSLVTVRQNHYSVPVALVGLRVHARIGAREITLSHNAKVVARHQRLHGKYLTSAQLDHYLELLKRKPAGLEHSLPLAQERERGDWPAVFDAFWQQLRERYGPSESARRMVDVLMLCREHGPDRIVQAVAGAMAAGAIDGRAVELLARRAAQRPDPPVLTGLDGRLAAHDRPDPDLDGYDQLIDGAAS